MKWNISPNNWLDWFSFQSEKSGQFFSKLSIVSESQQCFSALLLTVLLVHYNHYDALPISKKGSIFSKISRSLQFSVNGEHTVLILIPLYFEQKSWAAKWEMFPPADEWRNWETVGPPGLTTISAKSSGGRGASSQ